MSEEGDFETLGFRRMALTTPVSLLPWDFSGLLGLSGESRKDLVGFRFSGAGGCICSVTVCDLPSLAGLGGTSTCPRSNFSSSKDAWSCWKKQRQKKKRGLAQVFSLEGMREMGCNLVSLNQILQPFHVLVQKADDWQHGLFKLIRTRSHRRALPRGSGLQERKSFSGSLNLNEIGNASLTLETKVRYSLILSFWGARRVLRGIMYSSFAAKSLSAPRLMKTFAIKISPRRSYSLR